MASAAAVPPLKAIADFLRTELGLEGNLKEVAEAAAKELSVEATGLAPMLHACWALLSPKA